MALVVADRIKETTTTTGTGTVTLLGASTGFQSFAAVGNANTTYYAIVAQTGTEWEVGIGTYTLSGTTLARTTVLASSNSGAAVTFSAGTKDVFVTYPAGKTVTTDTLAFPPAIGTTTPAAGAFTTLAASSTATLSGLTASTALALDASKNAVSVTNTGTGNNVLATSPTLTNPTVTSYVESVVVIGTVTTTNTLSLTSGTVQTATLTASTACTFTMPTATAGKSFVLLLKQAAATGNGTATFTSVKWGTAGAPTITATAGKMDILTFITDGTNWYGSIAQGYTP